MWEILLFITGIVLLGVEILIIPGFGVAGISGIILIFVSIFLGMLGDWPVVNYEDIRGALYSLFSSLLLTTILAILSFKWFPKTNLWRKIVLSEEEEVKAGYISNPKDYSGLVGKTGQARSTLRPTGIAEIDGTRYDVVSQGEYIEEGQKIEVVTVENYRIIVRQIKS